ncbi:regulator [Streptomyces sp. GZWMJZ-114]|uniref:regulator n=1 Tax=Streptomyces sp. GZWMJZ-114 TaxID=2494734 RepID=UPI001012E6DB|nr:regulator [Streptomyces sp. GZWMJZ-114]
MPEPLAALCFAPLIRLVSEVDDHGPIRAGRLSATLPDLTTHQVRQATRRARALGLVTERPGDGLDLTEAGRDLADLYDHAARWARTAQRPSPNADFESRVQSALRRTLFAEATVRDGALARVSELADLWLAFWGAEADEPLSAA